MKQFIMSTYKRMILLACLVMMSCFNINALGYTIKTNYSGGNIIAKVQLRFENCIRENSIGELTLHPQDSFFEYGEGWNIAESADERLGVREWACLQQDNKLPATLEIPYALVNRKMVIPENAKAFGKDVAIALANYFDIHHKNTRIHE